MCKRVVFPAPMVAPPCSSEAESLGEADQADAVAGGDVEGDAGQQQTRAHAHVDITNGDHEKTAPNKQEDTRVAWEWVLS
ncbi:hypothetical protein BV882_38195 [Streptomyces sp. 46]|nr:hypothetical protein BV882_38195 [Streptomyces sp. 46]